MSISIENFDIFKEKSSNQYQLRTKSDVFLIEFDDKEQENIFEDIISIVKKEPKKKSLNFKKLLKQKHNESKVINVLKLLDSYSLIRYNYDHVEIAYPFLNKNLSVFGQGETVNKLITIALDKGFRSNAYPYNEELDELNIETIIKNSDFLLVDASEWSPLHIEIINEKALKYNRPWIYIGGIENDIFKIGPLFYGKETGCYNCLINRIKNNAEHLTYLNSYENFLKRNQRGSKPNIVPSFYRIVYDIIANLTILEVMNFFEDCTIPPTYRCLIEINYMTLEVTKHELLKMPYCEICKPQLQYNNSPWLDSISLNENK
jgi:bacteriocin biosynthesis cyclodehydratase domain-containing protein